MNGYEKGLRLWTWGFRAAGFTCFKIESSRGSKVLVAILGEAFEGILGCDYFSAYRKYRGDFNKSLQFCLAHLIRDVKFLITLPEASVVAYGQRLLEGLRNLFHTYHQREVTVHGQKWRNYEKNATFYLAFPVFRDSYVL